MGFLQDYFTIVVVFTTGAALYYFVVEFLFKTKKDEKDPVGKPKIPNASTPPAENMVERIKRLYNLTIKANREKEVKIVSIWLYPVRGIKGFKVNECGITPYGPKNDREWVIIDMKKLKPLACDNSHIVTFLRQKIESGNSLNPIELKIFFQDKECFPDIKKRSHILRFDKDYSKSEFVECAKGYRGYKESDDVNKWLSDVFE